MKSTYHIDSLLIGAIENNKLIGVLPLTKCKKFPSGSQLVSLPFCGSTIALIAENQNIEKNLIAFAKKKAGALGCSHIEIRGNHPLPQSDFDDNKFVNFNLDLSIGNQKIWHVRLHGKTRNQIRKAQRSNLNWKISSTDLIDDFYENYQENMHFLGSPGHSKSFFKNLIDQFSDQMFVSVVYLGNKPISSLWLTVKNGIVSNPWAGANISSRKLCAQNLNYWNAICWACDNQYTEFDFGRSIEGSPQAVYKKQWGGIARPLSHSVFKIGSGDISLLNPQSSKVLVLMSIWRKLPRSVVRWLGPKMIQMAP